MGRRPMPDRKVRELTVGTQTMVPIGTPWDNVKLLVGRETLIIAESNFHLSLGVSIMQLGLLDLERLFRNSTLGT